MKMGRIHGYTWTSSKQIYQIDTHIGTSPTSFSLPPNKQETSIEENMKYILSFSDLVCLLPVRSSLSVIQHLIEE